MAEFRANPQNVKALLKSRRVEQQALLPAARKLAPIVAAMTPKSNRRGPHTADSTRIEDGHMSIKGDRVAVRVVQTAYTGRNRPRGGAAAPLQFGNTITDQRDQFGKALAAMSVTGSG